MISKSIQYGLQVAMATQLLTENERHRERKREREREREKERERGKEKERERKREREKSGKESLEICCNEINTPR